MASRGRSRSGRASSSTRSRGDRRRRRLLAHANSGPQDEVGRRRPVHEHQGRSGFRQGTSTTVAGLSAPDRYTVQVVLNEALTPFVSVLAVGHAKIVPRDIVEQQGEAFGANPVGTGPFKFVRWEPGKEIVLAANPDSFDGPPRLARLVYRIFPGEAIGSICQEFEQGDLEESSVPPMCRDKISDPRYQYVRRPTFSVRFYGLNTRSKPLSDLRVRQAIAHALDREAMIQEMFLGQHQPRAGHPARRHARLQPAAQGRRRTTRPALGRSWSRRASREGRGLPALDIWSAARSERIEKEMLGVKRQLAAVGIPAEVHYETNWPAFSAAPHRGPVLHVRVCVARRRAGSGQFPLQALPFPEPAQLHALRQSRRRRPPGPGATRAGRRRRVEIYRRAEQIIVDEVPLDPGLALHVRAALPAVRAERGGERTG